MLVGLEMKNLATTSLDRFVAGDSRPFTISHHFVDR